MIAAAILGVNDAARSDGMTPLANAVVLGHLPAKRVLLEHKADVNVADSGGNSPSL